MFNILFMQIVQQDLNLGQLMVTDHSLSADGTHFCLTRKSYDIVTYNMRQEMYLQGQ